MMAPKRKSYTVLFKLKVIKYADQQSVYEAASVYGVTEKMIREWRKNKKRLMECNNKANRCRVKYKISSNNHRARLDEMLKNWIDSLRERDMPISGQQIQAKAREFHSLAQENCSFSASNGWLEKFLIRHNLTRRRISSTGRDLPVDAPNILAQWLHSISHLSFKNSSSVFNMDETSLYLDAPCKLHELFLSLRRFVFIF